MIKYMNGFKVDVACFEHLEFVYKHLIFLNQFKDFYVEMFTVLSYELISIDFCSIQRTLKSTAHH